MEQGKWFPVAKEEMEDINLTLEKLSTSIQETVKSFLEHQEEMPEGLFELILPMYISEETHFQFMSELFRYFEANNLQVKITANSHKMQGTDWTYSIGLDKSNVCGFLWKLISVGFCRPFHYTVKIKKIDS